MLKKASAFWVKHKAEFPTHSIVATIEDDGATFFANYPVWVADFNKDGKDDFLLEHMGGSAACISHEMLLSSKEGYVFREGFEVFKKHQLSGCSGLWRGDWCSALCAEW